MKSMILMMALIAGLAFSQSRFSVSEDVINDNVTGLEWRVGSDEGTSWDDANDWVNSLGDNWRMPTRSELRALWSAGIKKDSWGPFQNSGTWVWAEVRDSMSAWTYNFKDNSEDWGVSYVFGFTFRVFAVR